jgi:hypothetical protein
VSSAPSAAADARRSRRSILQASAIAFVAAAAVLVIAVLPAEYGIDPLGTGRLLGLLDLYNARTVAAPPITPPAGGPLFSRASRFRLDSRQIVVPSLGSIEFKYELASGASMMYAWRASAPIDFDFHTEVAGRPNASDTFERGEAAEASGFYTAPYDGIHGWYWENLNDTDVTISLHAAGFFSEARLFLPNAPPQRIVIPAPPDS